MKSRLLILLALVLTCSPGIALSQMPPAASTIKADVNGTLKSNSDQQWHVELAPQNDTGIYYPPGCTVNSTCQFLIKRATGCTDGRVQVTDSGSDDLLEFKCLIIKGDKANLTAVIPFWTEHVSGPDSPANYEVRMEGKFIRGIGAAKDDWIRFTGFLQYPPAQSPSDGIYGTWLQLGELYYSVPGTSLSYADFSQMTSHQPSNLAGNRILKGYLEFYMKNRNDELRLPVGLKVLGASQGGGNGRPVGPVDPKALKDLLEGIKNSLRAEALRELLKELNLPPVPPKPQSPQ